ncbi:MAG: phosphate acyltransferase PlsX [Oscillospiraceae bacterium]|nr:phosphate acyltransferase PlsX [Oscillospiraceae bacterium]
MNIVVDAFGGDNAPISVIKGCLLALDSYRDIKIILSGNKDMLEKVAKENNLSLSRFEICNAKDIIDVEDNPMEICKSKILSSMAVGMNLLKKGDGDAFVSAGSTGALAVGSSLLVGRIKGVKRAALAPVMPSAKGCFMLLDAGANLECRPEMLLQFAIMGSIYSNKVLGVKNPKIGLANVGTESSKGTEAHKQAYILLKQCDYINFIGNVEARDIPFGACDVVVSDGLSGNMILKTMEGTSNFFVKTLRDMYMQTNATKIAAALMSKQNRKLKKRMDYTEYGGAVFIGISRPIIKAHGNSDANAFKNAIRQARECIKQGIIDEISKNIGSSIGDE